MQCGNCRLVCNRWCKSWPVLAQRFPLLPDDQRFIYIRIFLHLCLYFWMYLYLRNGCIVYRCDRRQQSWLASSSPIIMPSPIQDAIFLAIFRVSSSHYIAVSDNWDVTCLASHPFTSVCQCRQSPTHLGPDLHCSTWLWSWICIFVFCICALCVYVGPDLHCSTALDLYFAFCICAMCVCVNQLCGPRPTSQAKYQSQVGHAMQFHQIQATRKHMMHILLLFVISILNMSLCITNCFHLLQIAMQSSSADILMGIIMTQVMKVYLRGQAKIGNSDFKISFDRQDKVC